jgi:hypothetical protein
VRRNGALALDLAAQATIYLIANTSVAEVLTGPNWGSQFIPRIGTELLVNFNVGDMDRTCGAGPVAQQF